MAVWLGLVTGLHAAVLAPTPRARAGSASAWQRYARYDAGSLAASAEVRNVTVVLRSRAPAALQEFLAEVQNPDSAQYHRWLTPRQFADRFGASPQALSAVESWLGAAGMSDVRPARGGMWVTFSGSAKAVETLFQTQLRSLTVNGSAHFANATSGTLSHSIQIVVAGSL